MRDAVLANLRLQVVPGGGRRSLLPLSMHEQLSLERFFADPSATRERRASPRVPPGPPIGCGHAAGLFHTAGEVE